MKNLIVMLSLSSFMSFTTLKANIAAEGNTNKLLQFTAEGHVIAFMPECIYLSGSDHMLKVTFQNAHVTTPEARPRQTMEGRSRPLERVLYPELWDGISLTYERKSGSIAKSTYIVSPGSNAEQISLLYNVPVLLNKTGKLVFEFETGRLSETAPVAWQMINGERLAVDVEFCRHKEKTIGFKVGKYNPAYRLIIDPSWEWNTFMGSSSDDRGYGIAVDGSGNVYVTGRSGASWGSPVNAHAGWVDAFVAKLNNSGVLQWNTFLGGAVYDDFGLGIAVDGSGNVYVAGYSDDAWGSPVNDYAGGNFDAFAAKLNSSGVLQWNTFMGSSVTDVGNGIAVDGSGNVYVTGDSRATWGTPVNAYAGGNYDAFVVKLNSNGGRLWNTFMGSSGSDYGRGIAVDGSGNVYVTGYARYSWGSPVNAHAGNGDAFTEKLNSNGVRQWNTFMGSSSYISEEGYGITVDGSNNVYVTGMSYATWGAPVNAHAGYDDAFAVKLNSSGGRLWNTFMGSSEDDAGYGIAVDGSGNVVVTGYSDAAWGTPGNAHAGGEDAFAVKLNSSGGRLWNTFMGGSENDAGKGIAVDGSGNAYVAGITYLYEWGTPVNPHSGWGNDAFAVKFDHSSMVGVENDLDLPTEFKLSQNYPNPFNALTIIEYAIPRADHVTLTVYNILGEEVQTLVNEFQTQGNYAVAFDATRLTSGIYFYKLNIRNSYVKIKKMTLIE
jgi:hypothetical protein